MNLRILLTISFILSAYLMSAQSPTLQRGSYVGLTGGVGTVWIIGQHNYGITKLSAVAHNAYTGGFVGGITFKRGHGIHGELLFSTQKHDYRDTRYIDGQDRKAIVGKQLDFKYLRIPVTYRKIIGIRNGDADIGDSNFFWGAGIDTGVLYDVQLDYTVNGKSDDRFVFTREFNPNVRFPPYDDHILFNSIDVALTGSFGWEHFLTQHLVFQAEIKETISIFDINDAEWRITDDSGKYTSSHHKTLHFKCSLIYYVNKVKRLDVY